MITCCNDEGTYYIETYVEQDFNVKVPSHIRTQTLYQYPVLERAKLGMEFIILVQKLNCKVNDDDLLPKKYSFSERFFIQ